MADVPADVTVVCSLCPNTYALPDSVIHPDVLATSVAVTGRNWYALCPACTDFLTSRR